MGVRTIRRRTIRRGQFVADNSAQIIIISFIENPASISATSFHQSRFYFNYMFSSIPLLFQQYFFVNAAPISAMFFINPASISAIFFSSIPFHFINLFHQLLTLIRIFLHQMGLLNEYITLYSYTIHTTTKI